MGMYHGTWRELESLEGLNDICLTHEKDIAKTYNSMVYAIEVDPEINLATESEFLAVLEDEGYETTPGIWFFEIADQRKARELVASKGYQGVMYDDATEDNFFEHVTFRVWDMSALTLGELQGDEDE